MKTELQYLVYVTVFTGLLWVPYILDRMATPLPRQGSRPRPSPARRWCTSGPAWCTRWPTRSRFLG